MLINGELNAFCTMTPEEHYDNRITMSLARVLEPLDANEGRPRESKDATIAAEMKETHHNPLLCPILAYRIGSILRHYALKFDNHREDISPPRFSDRGALLIAGSKCKGQLQTILCGNYDTLH